MMRKFLRRFIPFFALAYLGVPLAYSAHFDPPQFDNAPVAGDCVVVASDALRLHDSGVSSCPAGVTNINGQTGAFAFVIAPQGRLTLQTHTPVMSTAQINKNVIFYDSYLGGFAPIYNGTNDIILAIGSNEISDTLPSSGTGVVNNADVFDEWLVNNAGVATLCHATNGAGGGWASDAGGGSTTSRGTGYSSVDKQTRSYVTNGNTITNCYNNTTQLGPITVNKATHLGTFGTTAAGQTGVTTGSSASGGGVALLMLWNRYGRVNVAARVVDSQAAYTYTSATTREAGGSTTNRVSFVSGDTEDGLLASIAFRITTLAVVNAFGFTGIGLDTTNSYTCQPAIVFTGAAVTASGAGADTCSIPPQIGLHAITKNEAGDTANANSFNGQAFDSLQLSWRF